MIICLIESNPSQHITLYPHSIFYLVSYFISASIFFHSLHSPPYVLLQASSYPMLRSIPSYFLSFSFLSTLPLRYYIFISSKKLYENESFKRNFSISDQTKKQKLDEYKESVMTRYFDAIVTKRTDQIQNPINTKSRRSFSYLASLSAFARPNNNQY